MLPEGHPHAWKAEHADEHLDPGFRRQYMATGSTLVLTPALRQLINGVATDLESDVPEDSTTRVGTERVAGRRSGLCTVVSGPWGAGKSTLLQALIAVADVNTVQVEIPESANAPAAQWAVLTTALTGTASGTARAMQCAALDYLTVVPTLLVVDEAQHLTHAALRQLRWLWSARLPRFAIVLAGSNLDAHIAKDQSVATRVNRRIAVKRLGTDRMLDLLRRSNPDLAATPRELLAQIEEAYGHGSWRNWSELILKATLEFGHTGPLTFETVADVVYDRTGLPLAVTGAGSRDTRRGR
ncbi:ATP-binding protein [Nocardioides sp. AX2bis]|uniref:ATP-binding protein n=1 Tax=Nocardioides sp. AX2bis TaxID=2653157 RepID=UPI001F1BABD5|nr:ATP-binding protein [Nocardioides sp. AX2bis]